MARLENKPWKMCVWIPGIFILLFTISMPVQASIPGWAKVPNRDSEKVIWGIGSGNTFDRAKRKALSSISGKINREVKSNLRQLYKERPSEAFRTYNVSAKLNASDLDQIQHRTVKSSKTGGLYWIEIKMQKDLIAAFVRSNWQSVHDKVDKRLQAMAQLSSLEQLVQAPSLTKKVKKAEMMVIQMQLLDKHQETSESMVFYEQAYDRLLAIQKNYEVRLVNHDVSEEFKQVLENQLTKSGLRVTDVPEDKVSSSIEIESEMALDQDDRGAYLCALTMKIVSFDQNRQELASSEYSAKGRSYEDENDAIKKAASSLRVKLKRMPLEAILNLDE